MAKPRLVPVVNFVEVITANDNPQDVSLTGKSLALISRLLDYASSHGPAIYGVKGQRNRIPAYEQVINETRDQIDYPVESYTTWDKIKSDESPEKTVTLDGKALRLVRGLLRNAQEKGKKSLGVGDDPIENDEFDALVSGVISDLSS